MTSHIQSTSHFTDEETELQGGPTTPPNSKKWVQPLLPPPGHPTSEKPCPPRKGAAAGPAKQLVLQSSQLGNNCDRKDRAHKATVGKGGMSGSFQAGQVPSPGECVPEGPSQPYRQESTGPLPHPEVPGQGAGYLKALCVAGTGRRLHRNGGQLPASVASSGCPTPLCHLRSYTLHCQRLQPVLPAYRASVFLSFFLFTLLFFFAFYGHTCSIWRFPG